MSHIYIYSRGSYHKTKTIGLFFSISIAVPVMDYDVPITRDPVFSVFIFYF